MSAAYELETFAPRETLRRMTISHATDLWLGELARRRKSVRTRDTYRRLLDKLADRYPHEDVEEINATKCRRFLDGWQNHSPATIAQNVSILTGFFDWLEQEKLIRRTPMERIYRPSLPAPDENDAVVTVTTSEVHALLAAARGWDERLAVNALCYLGPRRHAISSARIGDYDPQERTLTFREKGSKTIRKPVPDALADLIDLAVSEGVYEDETSYLVPSGAPQRRKGDRDDRVIWRIIRRVAERAGVTTHVHALRAAFAVQFLRSKPGELIALQKLMGHSRVETTMVYLRRLNRAEAMETVRDLAWGDNTAFPQIAGEPLVASRVTEKEGFEPSFHAKVDAGRAGTQHGAHALVSDTLIERIRASRPAQVDASK